MTTSLNDYKLVPIDELKEHPQNPRIHPGSAIDKLTRSIEEFGFTQPILVSKDGYILAGHARLKASKQAGLTEVPVIFLDLEGEKATAYLIADNKLQEETDWDLAVLKDLMDDLKIDGFDLELTGFSEEEIEDLMSDFNIEDDEYYDDDGSEVEETANKTLAERFGVPPFSVLDARQGYWISRKKAWLSIGIKSELGRGGDLLDLEGPAERQQNYARTFGQDLMKGEHIVGNDKSNNKIEGVLFKSDSGRDPSYYQQKRKVEKELGREISTAEFQEKYYVPKVSEEGGLSSSGTSVFDPVLCELAYTWFSAEGQTVIDPFAGGSVRGIVASRLGRNYYGIDLRQEQIEANRQQAEDIAGLKTTPNWFVGDSQNLDTIIPSDVKADLIFSCPPYADLEVYSDDPNDLSTMEYEDFLKAYRIIIKKAVDRLKDDSFACFVVGDVRDKKGFYRNFVSDTIQAFLDAGMGYYNEAILVTSVGSLGIRVGRQFGGYRKLGKTHQNVLVFYKGNPKKIPDRLGEVSVDEIMEVMDEENPEIMDGVQEL